MNIQTKNISDQEIIDACNNFHNHCGDTPDKALANKYPEKVILSKMAKMEKKGILEYGVSLRTSWVKQ